MFRITTEVKELIERFIETRETANKLKAKELLIRKAEAYAACGREFDGVRILEREV